MRDKWFKKKSIDNAKFEFLDVFCINPTKDRCFGLGTIARRFEADGDIYIISELVVKDEYYGISVSEDEFKKHFERM